MRRGACSFAILSAVLVLSCRGTEVGAQNRSFAQPVGAQFDYPASQPAIPAPVGPYQVDLVSGDGAALPVFSHHGRRFVLGAIGDRYVIRLRNPTPNRVEAVVSVDGIDAVDGRSAGYEKRGYILAPYGEALLEGFRTSASDVATFRFSSVRDSYAARQGRARNVGVIGVAFFRERDRPPPPPEPPIAATPRYHSEDDGSGATRDASQAPPRSERERAASPSKASAASPQLSERRGRPGLGTEFGERRWSQIEYRRFERQDASSPAWVYELRYDDREGLLARGLPVDTYYGRVGESQLRDTAEPFPARRFAEPPTSD